MAKNLTLDKIGLDSWLEVYKSIEGVNLTHKKTVYFNAEEEDGVEVCVGEMCLDCIKARAFDEIYQSLPREGVADVVFDMLIGSGLKDTEINAVAGFLRKLPTRQKLKE